MPADELWLSAKHTSTSPPCGFRDRTAKFQGPNVNDDWESPSVKSAYLLN